MRNWFKKKPAIPPPKEPPPGESHIYGELTVKMRELKPGQAVRIKVTNLQQEYVLLYGEDFDFILDKAHMRAID